MKSYRGTWLLLASAVALVCFETNSLGAVNSSGAVNMALTGLGAGNVMAGIYTSPYTGTANGTTTAIICDAFADETFMNETWQANVSTVANLGATMWGGTSSQQAYDAAGALASQLLATSDATQMGYLSFAIWDIFDHSDVQSWLAAQNAPSVSAVAHAMAQNALNQTYSAGQFSNVLVYTSIPGTPTGCGGPCPANSPQEFLAITTPEPPERLLLPVYLLSFVGLVVLFRRRLAIR